MTKSIADSQEIWRRMVDGKKTRILKVAEDDCMVEELLAPPAVEGKFPEEVTKKLFLGNDSGHFIQEDKEGFWYSCDDKTAARVYMMALLEALNGNWCASDSPDGPT